MTDAVGRIVPILLRPFFWISGIFFIAAELPRDIAALLWWNPLLHVTEHLRFAYFTGTGSGFGTLWVPLGAIALCYTASRLIEATHAPVPR